MQREAERKESAAARAHATLSQAQTEMVAARERAEVAEIQVRFFL